MINLTLLSVFIPTFLFVSITPGLCMTLSMTLGISLGVRRTLWMMWGEMLGVALVATSAVLGVAALLLGLPQLLVAFKWLGGAYLCYVGLQMWQSRGKLAIPAAGTMVQVSRRQLFWQGLLTAVSNPKGWAFHMALLPPFIDAKLPFWPQLAALLAIILLLEFGCLLLYASGGKAMRLIFAQEHNVRLLNRIAGSLMLGVGVWLALS
ncbi:MAG: LysE family translocator [Gammaproteobacteria bacterium]|jgi:homoserine/homoserine lactone efflux protein|nr:LysE family translocator [Gammaproteobacteria bacterium]MBU2425411.1 LysE family translocator [Gammaproteobacteria bacterium]